MKYGLNSVERVRSIMGRDNPVPPGEFAGSGTSPEAGEVRAWITAQIGNDAAEASEQAWRRLATGPQAANRRAWRVVAPAAAALAVAGLVIGLTLATGTSASRNQRPESGGPADHRSSLPLFYVTVTLEGPSAAAVAEVHSSRTGQVVSHAHVGYYGRGVSISADRSDRMFTIAAATSSDSSTSSVALYVLRISARGQVQKLTRLATGVPSNSAAEVTGIALSPDASKIAIGVQLNANPTVLNPHSEVLVASLNGGATRIWTAPRDIAILSDPQWSADGRNLTFVWQDHLTGKGYFFTGRSQIRVLDTTAPGGNLLRSTVLVTGGGKVGFIQGAYDGQAGAPIVAVTVHASSIGGRGSATVRLIELSTSGAVVKVLASHAFRYSNSSQEAFGLAACQVLGVDASGRHTLAYCPDLGSITNGTFTPLAHSPHEAFVAAW